MYSPIAAMVVILAASFLHSATPAPQARITLVERNAAPGAQASAESSVVRKQLPGLPDREAYPFSQSVHLGTPVTEQVQIAFHSKTTVTGIEATNDFHVVGGSCRLGAIYAEGDTCTVAVSLEPKGPGKRAGLLKFSSAEGAKPDVVGLQGYTQGAVISFVPAQIVTLPQSFVNNAPLLYAPGDVAVDQGDNLYVSDQWVGKSGASGVVYTMDSSNAITTLVGGGGVVPQAGVANPNAQMFLNQPYGIAVDSFLDLYVAEWGGNQVDEVTQGKTYGFAGFGSSNPTNCNPCSPTAVQLSHPASVRVDNAQNVFLNDTQGFYSVPWNPANPTAFNTLTYPGDYLNEGLTFGLDSMDNIYATTNIFGAGNCQVGGINPSSGFKWVALGSGPCAYSGNNVRSQNAEIGIFSGGYAFDAAGNMYYNDWTNQVLRRVDSYNGLVRAVAGNNSLSQLTGAGYTGDGGPATDATLSQPMGIAVDSMGAIYTTNLDAAASASTTAYVIRKIGPNGQRNFPTTLVGKTSQVMTVLLTNTGNDALTVTNQIMGGANPGDFVSDPATTSCSWTNPLASGRSCQLGFSCKPTAAGMRTATVTFVDNTATFQNTLYLGCQALAAQVTPTVTLNAPTNGAKFIAGSAVGIAGWVDNGIAQIPTPPTGSVNLKVTNTTTSTTAGVFGPQSLTPVAGMSRSTIAPYSLMNLPVGNYSVTGIYGGDALDNLASSSPTTFSIVQVTPNISIANPTVSSSALPGTVNASIVVTNAGLTPAAPAAPTGTVNLTLSKVGTASTYSFTGTLVPGSGGVSTVTIPMTNLVVANYTLVASYTGDTCDAPVMTGANPFSVVQLNPIVYITNPVSNFTFVPGTAIPTTVTVFNNNMKPIDPSSPTGSVLLTFINTTTSSKITAGPVQLVTGPNGLSTGTIANPVPNITAGNWALTANYSGDTDDAAATGNTVNFTVQQDKPSITIVSPTASTYNYGTAIHVYAKVSNYGLSPSDPSAPTGTVTFTITNTTTKAVSSLGSYALSGLSTGVSQTSTATYIQPVAGNYSIVATYNGDTADAPVTSAVTYYSVVPVVPTLTWPTPAWVYVGTKLSSTQLNAVASALGSTLQGTYVYTPPAGTVMSTAGTFPLKVVFTPNDNVDFTTATTTVNILVQSQITVLPKTSTGLASAQNPVQAGKPVQLNAAVKPVSGSTSPSGTVTLSENGKALTVATLASGTAKLSIAGLAPGTHILTAAYSGDKQHQGSTSAPLQQIIVTVVSDPAVPRSPTGLKQ